MKIKKKVVIPIVAVAVLGGAAAFFVPKIVDAATPKPPVVSVTALNTMELSTVVSVTGTVKSDDATNVYSTLSYPIKSIMTEVGDKVSEGDVLCEIDTEDLQAKIEQQTVSLSQSQAKLQHSLNVAIKNLETEKFNQENNFDSQLVSAEKGVETAKQNLENAQLSLRSAQLSLSANRKDLQDYRDTEGYNSDYYDATEASKRLAVQQGEISVIKAEDAVTIAKQAVKDAEDNLKTVEILNQEALISSQDQVTSAQLNADMTEQQMQLDEMKKDLEEATVKAPVSGTVTAVFAVEGGSGQGLLFVIENTNNLIVTTKIKEYDIASVAEGQDVKIKSDGTGDDEYSGKVTKIAPTAVKDAKGETVETTDVEFETQIGVTGASKLRIGMNARVEIITEKKDDVFAVPYDAVVENANGESVIYVARPQFAAGENGMPGEGTQGGSPEAGQNPGAASAEGTSGGERSRPEATFAAVEIPVQTGMETDFYIEISSDSLMEGDLIISDPTNITDGIQVTLGEGAPGGGRQGGGNRSGPGMGVRIR